MLSSSVCPSNHRHPLPVRGGGGQAAPLRSHPGPGPSGGCALCAPSWERQCQFAQHSTRCRRCRQRLPLRGSYQGIGDIRGRKVPGTYTVIKILPSGTRIQPQCSAGSPPPYAPQARVGPVPNTSYVAKRRRKCCAPFLQGRVLPCCYSSTPQTGKTPSAVFRAARKRSCGPLAQRVPTVSKYSTVFP